MWSRRAPAAAGAGDLGRDCQAERGGACQARERAAADAWPVPFHRRFLLVSAQHTSRPRAHARGGKRPYARSAFGRALRGKPAERASLPWALLSRSVQRLDRFQQRHACSGFPFAVRQKYAEDQGGYLAASVTYYAFFSIFPLLLVLVTLLGYALEGDPDLQRRVLDSALADFPVIGPQLKDNVHSLRGSAPRSSSASRRRLGGHRRRARAGERPRPHLGRADQAPGESDLRRLRALLWIAALGGITLAGTVLASAERRRELRPGGRALALVISFAINIAVFLAVFRVLTSASPCWREMLPGALVAAIAWDMLQTLGGYIVDHQLRHASGTYGVFAIVIGLLSWIYLAAM